MVLKSSDVPRLPLLETLHTGQIPSLAYLTRLLEVAVTCLLTWTGILAVPHIDCLYSDVTAL